LHGSQPSLGTTSSIDPHVNSIQPSDAVRILHEAAHSIAAATIFFVLARLIKIIVGVGVGVGVGVFFELCSTGGSRQCTGIQELSAVR